LHHVGFVVRSIDQNVAGFGRSISARWDGQVFLDPLQKAKVTFLQPPCSSDALIELVEPNGEDSPVEQFLKKGGGLHHLCYEVAELETHLRAMQGRGAVIVKPPLPAVAFGNRRIAWVWTLQRLLLEFLEAGKPSDAQKESLSESPSS
jgi:methylmalonyl-CoA/ethylmalonyl-CoA epimerase